MNDKNTYWIHPDAMLVILSALKINHFKAIEEGNVLRAEDCRGVYRQVRAMVDAKYPDWITSPSL